MIYFLPFFLLLFSEAQPRTQIKPKVQKVRIFYYDMASNPTTKVYRELHNVGEEPYWAKPTTFDIVVDITGTSKSVDEKLEISIEELQKPTGLAPSSKSIGGETWVLHKVVYSGNSRFILNNQLVVKGVQYKTAYFISSYLYTKSAFRVSCLFYDLSNKHISRAYREITYSD